MRIVAAIAAVIIVLFAVMAYFKSTQKTLDDVRDTTSTHGAGYIEAARQAVDQANRATEETQKQAKAAVGE